MTDKATIIAKLPTIYDVAKAAGVSPATVSRVFNGQNVSPAKIESVLKAAAEMSFVPNRTARNLRRRQSEVIALIIPDIENPFFTSLARGVEDTAQHNGYSVVLCNSDEDQAKEIHYLWIAASESMAGVIIAAAGNEIDLAPLGDRPVVAVDRRVVGFKGDSVTVNGSLGMFEATRALAEAGYKRIALLAGPEKMATSVDRVRGWSRVQGHAPELLRYTDFRIKSGRTAILELLELDNPPDAIVASNNMLGLAAVQELGRVGLLPPQIGLSILGELPFEFDPPEGAFIIPLNARSLGSTATRLLIDRVNGDESPPRKILLPDLLESALMQ